MATKAERKQAAYERANAAADEIAAQQKAALDECVQLLKESNAARRAFIRSLFRAYKLRISYQTLADALQIDVAGVYRLMRRHNKDGRKLTPEKRGREDLRAVGNPRIG